MMVYVEIAQSQGEGTLIKHRVMAGGSVVVQYFDGIDKIAETIDKSRYDEFIAIHGGDNAV